jgi:outer membrane immunogenic protein
MKTISAGLLIAMAASSTALAADMGTPYSKAPAPAAYDWSGVYIGGHVGGGWQDTSFADPGALPILFNCCVTISSVNNPGPISDGRGSSFLGGVQAGWMYQVARLVVGADIDWSGTRLNSSGATSLTPADGSGFFANDTYSVRTNWTVTATTTVGIARDHWLFYGKAGAAFANDNYGISIAGAGGQFGAATPFAFASSDSQTVVGWTVGTGVKWAVSDNWFVNAEYDYMDFGTKTPNLSGTFTASPASFGGFSGNSTFKPSYNQNLSEVKVGLNYKFSGLPF